MRAVLPSPRTRSSQVKSGDLRCESRLGLSPLGHRGPRVGWGGVGWGYPYPGCQNYLIKLHKAALPQFPKTINQDLIHSPQHYSCHRMTAGMLSTDLSFFNMSNIYWYILKTLTLSDVDECDVDPCTEAGTECANTIGSFVCVCATGFVLVGDDCVG